MTPRNPLPRAAIAAARDAQAAVGDAAGMIRRIWRKETRDPDGDYAQALDALARVQRLLDEAIGTAKGGGVEPDRWPDVGDDVWYFDDAQGGPLRVVQAAKITAVRTSGDPRSAVNLAVFAPPLTRYLADVPRGRSPGCWDWPGR